MKKDSFLLIIGAMILVSAIFLRAVQLFDKNKATAEITPSPATTSTASVDIPEPIATATRTPVFISSPTAEATVSSPLFVSGQALGSWFFEATLPVKLLAADGTEIATHYATAQSDWMVAGLVPFTATLEFTTTATSGYLVISKDNPSGLPENDASFMVPVNF